MRKAKYACSLKNSRRVKLSPASVRTVVQLKSITLSEYKGNTYFLNTKQKSIKFYLNEKNKFGYTKKES